MKVILAEGPTWSSYIGVALVKHAELAYGRNNPILNMHSRSLQPVNMNFKFILSYSASGTSMKHITNEKIMVELLCF